MQLADQIDRRAGLSRDQFDREYLRPLRPVILTDAISHWRALGRWSPQFFKERIRRPRGRGRRRGDGPGRPDRPRRGVDGRQPRTVLAQPGPGRMAARALRRRVPDAGLHTAQLAREPRLPEGRGAFVRRGIHRGPGRAVSHSPLRRPAHPCLPDAALRREGIHRRSAPSRPSSCTRRMASWPTSPGSTTCSILTLRSSRCSTRPRAFGFHFIRGRPSSCPAGWWHTARIVSPSVTVSINSVNRANGAAFRRDYCEALAQRSNVLSFVARAGLLFGQTTRLFEFKYLNRR